MGIDSYYYKIKVTCSAYQTCTFYKCPIARQGWKYTLETLSLDAEINCSKGVAIGPKPERTKYIPAIDVAWDILKKGGEE